MTATNAVPVARYRTDLITSLLSVWLTVGLMLDAWAHNNLAGLETFFTPWHAVFYSGFLAVAAWITWTVWPGIRNGQWEPSAMPPAYPAAALALAGFAIAGVGDYTWHKIFGIEQSINILFSPTHLGLAAAMMVIITTPLRSFWSDPTVSETPGLRRAFPALLSLALATTLTLLFFQYANVLVYQPAGVVFSLSGGNDDNAASFVASLAVTNVILLAGLLLLALRCRLPLGAFTIVYTVAAGLAAAITGFESVDLLAGLIVAGLAVDGLNVALRPGPDRAGRLRLFAFLAPTLTWTVYLVTASALARSVTILRDPNHPESGAELWTGAPLVQGLVGLLIASVLLAAGARRTAGVRASVDAG